MKVLSTTQMTPFSLQILASAAMSQTFKVGLVGVSAQTTFVFGLILSLTSYKSVKSTIDNSTFPLSDRIRLKYL